MIDPSLVQPIVEAFKFGQKAGTFLEDKSGISDGAHGD